MLRRAGLPVHHPRRSTLRRAPSPPDEAARGGAAARRDRSVPDGTAAAVLAGA